MTGFLAESRERSSEDGMSYESLVNNESQKIKKTALSTTVAELYSFMKCFGSCEFLRGLWTDISGEVPNVHVRADAKNLVTTARTLHPPEQKETIHMISKLGKEACSGSVQDLIQNRLADCLTKTISKGRHFDYSREDRNIARCWHSPWFESTYATQGLLILLVLNIYVHEGERSFISKHSQEFSCTISSTRIISGDVCKSVWRASIFRHICNLSCCVVRDCHSPLSFEEHFVLMPVWLKANQSICTSWEFVGVHQDEKGSSLRLSLLLSSSWPPCQRRSKKKRQNHYSFVGSCLVSSVFRHVRSTQKEQFNNHKVRLHCAFADHSRPMFENSAQSSWRVIWTKPQNVNFLQEAQTFSAVSLRSEAAFNHANNPWPTYDATPLWRPWRKAPQRHVAWLLRLRCAHRLAKPMADYAPRVQRRPGEHRAENYRPNLALRAMATPQTWGRNRRQSPGRRLCCTPTSERLALYALLASEVCWPWGTCVALFSTLLANRPDSDLLFCVACDLFGLLLISLWWPIKPSSVLFFMVGFGARPAFPNIRRLASVQWIPPLSAHPCVVYSCFRVRQSFFVRSTSFRGHKKNFRKLPKQNHATRTTKNSNDERNNKDQTEKSAELDQLEQLEQPGTKRTTWNDDNLEQSLKTSNMHKTAKTTQTI